MGLTPRQRSSGGEERLGRITKMGDRYLRKLLVVGATTVLHHAIGHNDSLRRWARQILKRKGGRAGFKLGGGGARQQAGAHCVCRPVLGRGLRRPPGRGLSEKGLGKEEFRCNEKALRVTRG
jgi:hypothetical protein